MTWVRNATLACLVCSLLAGCGIFKKKGKGARSGAEAAVALEKLAEERVDFEDMELRYSVDHKANGKANSAMLIIRMRSDSLIWGTVRAGGILEVARVLADQDSARLINKFNNTYFIEEYDYLTSLIKADVSLSQLQDVILGNPLFAASQYRVMSDSTGDRFRVTQGYYTNTITINDQFRVMSSDFLNLVEGNEVKVVYDDYRDENGAVLPYNVNITTVSNGRRSVTNLSLLSVKTAPIVSFPFTIPTGYERKSAPK